MRVCVSVCWCASGWVKRVDNGAPKIPVVNLCAVYSGRACTRFIEGLAGWLAWRLLLFIYIPKRSDDFRVVALMNLYADGCVVVMPMGGGVGTGR